ncbi:VirB3 family type IV secretion system protein (plasmid) [Bradyrhizobium sp. 183]|uniref:VirB3 family type IV secretion system protein n=1 Tax=unclassified Bradyrhizobium TaxID=2631580 RepID=UPI001FFF9E75|nr:MULTISPECIES: VirB3 family type IV secretion system protein [unclassified Bradyrhizobium]UPJ84961.1 VirB3 family type IV secretion system protein [Bradyrhizobium sp. 184]UPJ92743.1 VirB3 family type IV secretion system protein [Bradyrhizobium sp. 183]
MQRTIVFLGLTREVAFAGLPVMHLVFLIWVVMLGFVVTKSFVYLAVMGTVGYGVLRALAAYDPKLISVFIATVQCTPISSALLKSDGLVYRA